MQPSYNSKCTLEPTKQEYTSTLRSIKYECTLPAAEVIARLDKAVNKGSVGSEGHLPHMRKIRQQKGLEEYVAEKSGDHLLYFNDFTFHKLLSIGDKGAESGNQDTDAQSRPLLVTYTIGDPLFAQKIIMRNTWAAVCIPPRLVVVEHADRSGTSVYFHTASSIMGTAAHGGAHDEDLEVILATLDRKVEELVVHITKQRAEYRVNM